MHLQDGHCGQPAVYYIRRTHSPSKHSSVPLDQLCSPLPPAKLLPRVGLFSDSGTKQDHTAFSLLCLAYFISTVSEVHLCHFRWENHLLCKDSVIFHGPTTSPQCLLTSTPRHSIAALLTMAKAWERLGQQWQDHELAGGSRGAAYGPPDARSPHAGCQRCIMKEAVQVAQLRRTCCRTRHLHILGVGQKSSGTFLEP